MTKRRIGVLLPVVLMAALALAVTASGHNIKIKTEIANLQATGSLQDLHVSGDLVSDRRACRVPRNVRLYGFENPKERGDLIAKGKTVDDGAFELAGNLDPYAGARVRALRKDIGAGHHKHICKVASDTVGFG
jgi:hypothetical protein